MATPEKHGLAKQFTRLIVLSGLASFLLLGFLQVVLNKSLRFYFDQPEVQTKASQQQVDELQNYISENALSSTDIQKLTDKYIAEVDEAFKKKEAEVMEI